MLALNVHTPVRLQNLSRLAPADRPPVGVRRPAPWG